MITTDALYTLRYETAQGPRVRRLSAADITRTVGPVISRMGDRGAAWSIAVLDADGTDVTFDFAVFA